MSTAAPADEPAWPTAPKRRTFPWRGLAAVVLGLALAGGGGYWYKKTRTPAPTFVAAEAEFGDVQSTITASGALAASRTVDVSSQVSGRVSQVLVDFNSPVKKGQVLARLEPQLLQASLSQARANQASARASVARARAQAQVAEREARRLSTLARQDFIAASELDVGRTNAEVARTQVTSAAAALSQADAAVSTATTNLGYAVITSPVDGVVIARNVLPGASVAASLQAPVLFQLAEDLKQLEVQASVAEADVGRLKPGMDATFTVDAYPGEKFGGTVKQIRLAPQTLQNVVTYTTIVRAANPEGKLKIGMTANVSFVEARHEDVLLVPNAALRFRPSEAAWQRPKRGERGASPHPPTGTLSQPGEGAAVPSPGTGEGARQGGRGRRGPAVFVQTAEGLKRVSVETGLTDGSVTEIVDGELTEGDMVVTEEVGATPPSARPNGGGNFGGGGRRGGGGRGGLGF